MKSIIFSMCLTLMCTGIFAQEEKGVKSDKSIITDTINLSGVCGMCKERIENAAYIKGVKKANWDKNTQQIIVVYRGDKTSALDIQKAIAAAGHDAGEVKAAPHAYESLPGCCKYQEVEVH